MPRDGNNRFYFPPNTEAVANDVARSADVNARMTALLEDSNIARPVSAGGTGATSALQARNNLSVPSKDEAVLKTGGDMTGPISAIRYVEARGTEAENPRFILRGVGSVIRTYLQFFAGTGITNLTLLDAAGSNLQQLNLKPSGVDINGDQILTAGMSGARLTNAVGSLAWLRSTNAAFSDSIVSGSTLTPAGMAANGSLFVGTSTMSGSWRARGACPAGGATMFERIS